MIFGSDGTNLDLGDLKRFLADGSLKTDYKELKKRREDSTSNRTVEERKQARVSQKNVGTQDGPLGEMSAEYSVKVATGDAEELPHAAEDEKKPTEGEKKRNDQKKPFRRGGGSNYSQKPKPGGSK